MSAWSLAAAFGLAAAPQLPASLWVGGDRFLLPPVPVIGDTEFGESVASCDLNGDGRADLVVGAPGFDSDSGSATIRFGAAARTFPTSQSFYGLPDEDFGKALACGDFDDDGIAELAVGAPEHLFDEIEEGRVVIYDWNGAALVQVGEFRQSLAGVVGAPENGDRFGAALAAGDFNGDGADDLAVGSPGEAVGAVPEAGAVTILYGLVDSGLVVAGNEIWHKDVEGVAETPAANEGVGWALAALDADCDSYADLAVGVPGQTVTGVNGAGTVDILLGSATGIVVAPEQIYDVTDFTQAGADTPLSGDRFGATLAASDGYFPEACGTLAIGAPFRQVGASDGAGALYLRAMGEAISRYFTVEHLGGSADSGERFASSVAFADFDRDDRPDLVIGVPGLTHFVSPLIGGVYLMQSGDGGEPLTDDAVLIRPDASLELFDAVIDDGALGFALAAGDFDGNGYPDLAIGLPSSDTVEGANVGGVDVLFGALFAADFEGGDDDEWLLP